MYPALCNLQFFVTVRCWQCKSLQILCDDGEISQHWVMSPPFDGAVCKHCVMSVLADGVKVSKNCAMSLPLKHFLWCHVLLTSTALCTLYRRWSCVSYLLMIQTSRQMIRMLILHGALLTDKKYAISITYISYVCQRLLEISISMSQ